MKSIVTLAIAAGFFLVCNQNRAYGDSRVGRAWMDVKSLDQAVTAWRLRLGEWPSSLEILTERAAHGSPALLKDASALIDPWGQAYHYDTKQLSHESGKPLIWCDLPPGASKGKIANWGEGSTYETPSNIPWVAIAVLGSIIMLSCCWICLPRTEKRLLRNPQSLSGWLLVGLVLWAAAYFCYVVYTTTLD